MDLVQNESQYIYQTLCSSGFMKGFKLECSRLKGCFDHTVDVLLNNELCLITGSVAEGTDITPEDYDQSQHPQSTLCYISDLDMMHVLYHVRVIEEGDTLPQTFDNYIYCRAERGKHTTAGYRKLKITHDPRAYSINQHIARKWARTIHKALENGYVSSAKFMDEIQSFNIPLSIPWKHLMTDCQGTKGPSHIMENHGFARDFVRCFYVKTWPKEAETWFIRQTHWPDKTLKIKIKKIGYLLVPTGNIYSQEKSLEWRCSFSIAEKKLFESMTKFQRYTFVMLKVLLKEYLPAHINTDGEKQLLSTYHIKTLFLWYLGDFQIKWVFRDMLGIIDHMLDILMRWINKKKFPHYFIPSVNLLHGRRLHGKKHDLVCAISTIKNDLSNKIKQSQFFRGQDMNETLPCFMIFHTYYLVMDYITGIIHKLMLSNAFDAMKRFMLFKFNHAMLLEGLISIKYERDSRLEHLYTTMYSDPVHKKLLAEVMPGLINQYLGCIYLAKYCMAKRDGHIMSDALYISETFLRNTLHLDPCSRYIKLTFLYIATGKFLQAMDKLEAAEQNCLCLHNKMKNSVWIAAAREDLNSDIYDVDINSDFIHDIFKKWTEGQVTSDIVVSWPEYTIVPELLQFELIHESTQQIMDTPLIMPGKMVGLNCHLQWSPLSMIQLLKFVCVFKSGQTSVSHMDNLVTELLVSGLSITVTPTSNDIYTVFNMAAWCYLKIQQYKLAAHIMTVAIESSLEDEAMKRCAFSYHFLDHIITQCLL